MVTRFIAMEFQTLAESGIEVFDAYKRCSVVKRVSLLFTCSDLKGIPKLNKQRQQPAVVGACKDCVIRGVRTVSLMKYIFLYVQQGIKKEDKGVTTVYPGAVRWLSFDGEGKDLREDWKRVKCNLITAPLEILDRPLATSTDYVLACAELEKQSKQVSSKRLESAEIDTPAYRDRCEFSKRLKGFDQIQMHRFVASHLRNICLQERHHACRWQHHETHVPLDRRQW